MASKKAKRKSQKPAVPSAGRKRGAKLPKARSTKGRRISRKEKAALKRRMDAARDSYNQTLVDTAITSLLEVHVYRTEEATVIRRYSTVISLTDGLHQDSQDFEDMVDGGFAERLFENPDPIIRHKLSKMVLGNTVRG